MRLIRHVAIAALVALFVMVLPAAAQAAGDECKKGGHENLSEDGGEPFKNQGQCVAFVNSGGTPVPVGGGGDGAPVITSFSPTDIPGGCPVFITGTGFQDVTQVLFGGVPAQGFTIVSSTLIVASSPAVVPPGSIVLIEAPHLPAVSEPYNAQLGACD